MSQDKGKYILQTLRSLIIPSVATFVMGMVMWGARQAVLFTILTDAVWMIGALVMFDLAARRVKRALDQISEEALWHDLAVFVDFSQGIAARGLLALTGSALVYIAFQDRAPRLDLPIGQILHAGFGELPRSIRGLKVQSVDGGEHLFIIGEEPYREFNRALQKRKREMP